jgi:hypothetical protein
LSGRPIHGDSVKGSKHFRLYCIWKGMLRRCESPREPAFRYYGSRGIRVCDAWHEYDVFKRWALSNGYTAELQIDRTDNDGNYEPCNCKWVTCLVNAGHTRRCTMLKIGNVDACVAEWARRCGVKSGTVYGWIKRYEIHGAKRYIKEIIDGHASPRINKRA